MVHAGVVEGDSQEQEDDHLTHITKTNKQCTTTLATPIQQRYQGIDDPLPYNLEGIFGGGGRLSGEIGLGVMAHDHGTEDQARR